MYIWLKLINFIIQNKMDLIILCLFLIKKCWIALNKFASRDKVRNHVRKNVKGKLEKVGL